MQICTLSFLLGYSNVHHTVVWQFYEGRRSHHHLTDRLYQSLTWTWLHGLLWTNTKVCSRQIQKFANFSGNFLSYTICKVPLSSPPLIASTSPCTENHFLCKRKLDKFELIARVARPMLNFKVGQRLLCKIPLLTIIIIINIIIIIILVLIIIIILVLIIIIIKLATSVQSSFSSSILTDLFMKVHPISCQRRKSKENLKSELFGADTKEAS